MSEHTKENATEVSLEKINSILPQSTYITVINNNSLKNYKTVVYNHLKFLLIYGLLQDLKEIISKCLARCLQI